MFSLAKKPESKQGLFKNKVTVCNRFFRSRTMLCIVLIKERGTLSFSHHLTCYTLPVVEMAHPSNVLIQGGIFNSAQGDIHINETDLGMHDFRSVQKSFLIDDSMKDFIPC